MTKTFTSEMPIVSVITPIFNGAEHVAACIKSVARSITGGAFAIEHILIDDGSTDDTAAVVQETAGSLGADGQYQHRFISLPHCGKPSHVRNVGISSARGKYIFCLDHDDVLLQNTLRYLLEHLETTRGAVAYGDFLRSDGELGYIIGDDYCGKRFSDAKTALLSLFVGDHFFQHSFMFTRDLWELVGGYDEAITFGEDFDLCTRFILAGHVPVHLPITTHFHRNHAKGMTAGYGERCAVWLAEHRAHYWKFRSQLTEFMTQDEIFRIENILSIAGESPWHSPPPTQEVAAELWGADANCRS